MGKTTATILLLLCLVVVACDGPKASPPPQETGLGADALLACADFERIAVGDYVLNNNVWNKGQRTDYTQCVYAHSDTPPTTMGWRWDWPGTGGQVKAYPEVMYGNSPWDDDPPTGALPLPVGDRDILVTYDASLEASGKWNVAAEMWITSDLPPAEHNITDEVMIWVDARGLVPGPLRYDRVTIDGVDYRLYVRRGHGDASGGSSATWSYIAFVSSEPMLSGTLDMGEFLGYLLEHQVIERDRYVACIELGTEVASGKGEFILSTYEIAFP